MKNTLKKYAQLVEAQSPEPQELDLNQDDIVAIKQTDDHPLNLPVHGCKSVEGHKTITDNELKIDMSIRQDDLREQSQYSQASASFENSESESQFTASYNGAPINSTSSGRGTNLTRTISRSMLELDKSVKSSDRFEVIWSNLSFSYNTSYLKSILNYNNGNKKADLSPVLRNISGRFKSNQLIAIIGPSGCGKTTLLHFLAGNNPNDADKLRIVGIEEPKVAFIGQDDSLLPGLTARETLIYASRLQNTDPGFDHHNHIKPILTDLNLIECADRKVTKLSGGQMKRVTIAQELLYPTNILILDEVTSGLDASTSYAIVKLLKQLVSDDQYPMSIVMSIHQPSARLFAVFDQVYVMSEGSCLYEGSCRIDIINEYLAKFNLECPKFHNIADYLIEIASDDLSMNQIIKEQLIQYQRKHHSLNCVYQDKQKDQDTKQIKVNEKGEFDDNHDDDDDDDDEVVDPYGKSGEHKAQGISMLLMSANETDKTFISNGISLHSAIERARSRRVRPIGTHLFVHLNRSLIRISRSYILTYLQFITYILLGLQLSTFYGPEIGKLSGCPKLPVSFMAFVLSHEDTDNLSIEMRRIQENMNFLLVAIMTATFAALEITVITFPLEAKTVRREWRNGWYKVSSYFMGRIVADLPFQMAFVIAFSIVVYTLTGQIGLTTWRFGSFVLIMIMTALIAQTVGFIFGALFMDNLPAAVFTAPLCIFPALLFSGFFSRVSQIPSFYKPMTYLSHFRYAFDALLVTLYGYDRCNCDEDALNAYHASLHNQTSTLRDMFTSLFGSSDCVTTPSPEENSIEDLTTMSTNDSHLLSTISPLNNSILSIFNTTSSPARIHTLEDAIVDDLFERMKSTTDTTPTGSAMDHLAYKFSSKVTSMLNSQANFGHEVPKQCRDFNSYLMNEFDLHDDDLLFGLAMLFVVVVLSRILCNAILSFTITTRAY